MKYKILFLLISNLLSLSVYSQCNSLDPFYSQITTESTWQKVSIGTNEKINDISFLILKMVLLLVTDQVSQIFMKLQMVEVLGY